MAERRTWRHSSARACRDRRRSIHCAPTLLRDWGRGPPQVQTRNYPWRVPPEDERQDVFHDFSLAWLSDIRITRLAGSARRNHSDTHASASSARKNEPNSNLKACEPCDLRERYRQPIFRRVIPNSTLPGTQMILALSNARYSCKSLRFVPVNRNLVGGTQKQTSEKSQASSEDPDRVSDRSKRTHIPHALLFYNA